MAFWKRRSSGKEPAKSHPDQQTSRKTPAAASDGAAATRPRAKKPDVERLRQDDDVDGLIAALGYRGTPEVAVKAAQALGESKDKRAIEPLLVAIIKDKRRLDPDLLYGGSRAVYQSYAAFVAAIEALGGVAGDNAPELLIDALADGDRGIRLRAAEALARLGDTRAVAPLIAEVEARSAGARSSEKARSDDCAAKQRAIRALALLKDDRAVLPLIAALKSKRYSIQIDAVRALGALGGDQAVQALSGLLRSSLRKQAAAALQESGWHPPSAEEQRRLRNALAPEKELPTFDDLTAELIAIGRSPGFLGPMDDTAKGFTHGVNRRTVTIGRLLHKMGGIELMLRAHSTIRSFLGDVEARRLEVAWGDAGIENWQP